MAVLMCPLCALDEDVSVVETLPDGRKRVECRRCHYPWVHGTPAVATPTESSHRSTVPSGRFPTSTDVDPQAWERAAELKEHFLATISPDPEPGVAQFWETYQEVFSESGLKEAAPKLLKDFANDPTGANPGNMSVFNNAWNSAGSEAAARQVRQVVDHLLRGDGALEQRLTRLINGEFRFSIDGFKESLLTKVLWVVEPQRFITLLTYDQKCDAVQRVYGLAMPSLDRRRIGAFIVASNDLLLELTGEGFVHGQHAGQFLWWASGRMDEGRPPHP